MALILSRDDLDRCLDMTSAIAAMRLAADRTRLMYEAGKSGEASRSRAASSI